MSNNSQAHSDLKRCARCGEVKSRADFYAVAARQRGDGLHSWCKRCCCNYERERLLELKSDAPRYDAWRRKESLRRKSQFNARRARVLRREYGITLEQWNAMRTDQENRCAICRELFVKTPHVDHCHRTGRVRSLLCTGCNTGLGSFRENPDFMAAAITYLKRFNFT